MTERRPRVRGSWSSRRTVLVALGLLLLVPVWGTVWFFYPPAEVGSFAKGPLVTWSKLRAEEAERGKKRISYIYVPLTQVSLDFQYALLAGEDIGYLMHGPWDTAAMREAISEWLDGKELRGGSTITQQLAKNLFLSEERSFLRKLREARYAYWLEEELGKRRVLELYVNMVELGRGVLGVEAGARHYFGVSAAALSTDQAAKLAAAIPSPLLHNPTTNTKSFGVRERAIRERMARYRNIRERLARAR